MCAFTKSWDETDQGGEAQNTIDDLIEDTRFAVRERADVEHLAYADETGKTDVWRHRKAAGRSNYGTAANKPTTLATGMVDGALYYETDTDLLKKYNSTSESWTTIASPEHSGATTTYTTGTVTVTNASAVVTGVGTAWVVGGIATADIFKGPDGEFYRITSIDSATQITLARNYDGVTAAGQSYTIYLDGHPQYLPKAGGTVDGAVTVNAALTMGAALAMGSNKITGLAAATANGDALRYEQVIAVMAKMKISTYTGNGATTQAITGVGFQPEFLYVHGQNGSYSPSVKTSQDGTKTKNTGSNWQDDEIISLDTDGFTVGDGTGGGVPHNVNGTVYTYVAMRYSA